MSQPISPAIIINENFDARPLIPEGYNVLCLGFTSEGVANEPFILRSLPEFITLFGEPDPSRTEQIYSFESAKRIIESGANLVFVKLPYGPEEGFDVGDEYSALLYPALEDTVSESVILNYKATQDITPEEFGDLKTVKPFDTGLAEGGLLSAYEYTQIIAATTTFDPAITIDDFVYNSNSGGLKTEYTYVVTSGDLNATNGVQLTGLESAIQSAFSVNDSGYIGAVGAGSERVPISDYQYKLMVEENPLEADKFKAVIPRSGATAEWVYVGASYPAIVDLGAYELYDGVGVSAGTIDLEVVFVSGLVANQELTTTEYLAMLLIMDDSSFEPSLLTEVFTVTDSVGYVLGQPVRIDLDENGYDKIQCGLIDWSTSYTIFDDTITTFDPVEFGKVGLIVLDSGRSKTKDAREGYYITVTDNTDGDPASDWDSITNIKTSTSTTGEVIWDDLSTDTYDFNLKAPFGEPVPSISQAVSALSEQHINGSWSDPDHRNFLNVTLWRLRKDVQNGSNQLIPSVVESHTGSISEIEKTITEGGFQQNIFLESKVEGDSSRLTVLVNPNIADDSYVGTDGQKIKNVRMWRGNTNGLGSSFLSLSEANFKGYSNGMYSVSQYVAKQPEKACDVGNIPAKLRNALCTVDNPERVSLDLSIEAGLGTIWNTVKEDRDQWLTSTQADNSFCFNDKVFLNVVEDLGRTVPEGSETGNMRTNWRQIYDTFLTFTESTRVVNGGIHHLHIADNLRHSLVNGRDCKVYDSKTKCKNAGVFQTEVYWPLKNLTKGLSNTITTIDAQWYKSSNVYSSSPVWIPSSPVTAALFAQTDFPWLAAAGVQRGLIRNVVDAAIDPVLRDRDYLFKIQQNAVFFDKNYDGFLRFADRTMLKNDNHQLKENSARRLLIWLEGNLQSALRPFLFEQNNLQTRIRFKNNIELYLNTLLQNGAIEDFNVSLKKNTLATQQDGCLVADIGITITGIVNQIKLNLNLLRLDQNFQEVF
jgi:hypothetical protein